MKVDHWHDEKGRWCARHVCGDPPHVSEWLCPEIVSDAPVWVDIAHLELSDVYGRDVTIDKVEQMCTS